MYIVGYACGSRCLCAVVGTIRVCTLAFMGAGRVSQYQNHCLCTACVLQASIGKLDVTNIQPTSATLAQLSSPITCAGSASATVAVLAPQDSVVCTATYTFDQDSLEAGARVFTANLSTGSELGADLVPASVTVNSQLGLAMIAAIAEASCVKPSKAGALPSSCLCLHQLTCRPKCSTISATEGSNVAAKPAGGVHITLIGHCRCCTAVDDLLFCTLEVKNTGNVRLQGVSVQGQSGCTGFPTLLPGASVTCNVSQVASQADFDSWDLALGSTIAGAGKLQLTGTVTAQPATGATMQAVTGTVAVPLLSRPSFKVLSAALLGGNQTIRAGETEPITSSSAPYNIVAEGISIKKVAVRLMLSQAQLCI